MNSQTKRIAAYLVGTFSILLVMMVVSIGGYLGYLDALCRCANWNNNRFEISIWMTGLFLLVSGVELIGTIRNPNLSAMRYGKDQDPAGMRIKMFLIVAVLSTFTTAAIICPQFSMRLGVGNVC